MIFLLVLVLFLLLVLVLKKLRLFRLLQRENFEQRSVFAHGQQRPRRPVRRRALTLGAHLLRITIFLHQAVDQPGAERVGAVEAVQGGRDQCNDGEGELLHLSLVK